eukprot:gb/GECG01003319.1/.p1 GENE.gb/GECG01003319.1/~~gb/GECG01003319.1/.p1  ORF type:complete len:217 (+),score=18.81 gb/GECG01003319.1/:1-651(+)
MVETRSQAATAAASHSSSQLEKSFCFYAQYHQNPVNQWIHIIFVPLILWSALVFFTYLGPVFGAWDKTAPLAHDLFPVANGVIADNASLLVGLLYVAYYISLSPGPLGLSAALLVGGLVYAANYYTHVMPADASTWQIAVVLHVVAWIVQFYGHGVHEGRAPALLDSFLQSLFMAPLFVYMEVLMKLGFLQDFKASAEEAVNEAVKQWKKEASKSK